MVFVFVPALGTNTEPGEQKHLDRPENHVIVEKTVPNPAHDAVPLSAGTRAPAAAVMNRVSLPREKEAEAL